MEIYDDINIRKEQVGRKECIKMLYVYPMKPNQSQFMTVNKITAALGCRLIKYSVNNGNMHGF